MCEKLELNLHIYIMMFLFLFCTAHVENSLVVFHFIHLKKFFFSYLSYFIFFNLVIMIDVWTQIGYMPFSVIQSSSEQLGLEK